MNKNAKFWSPNVILASGVLISPIAAPVLQLLNYQSAGEKKEVRNSGLWIVAMLLAVVGWNMIPLQLTPIATMAAGGAFAFILVVIWFFAYGRHFPSKVDSEVLNSATSRSAVLGIIVAIAVAIISYYSIAIALRMITTE
jgi:hypothetical protein